MAQCVAWWYTGNGAGLCRRGFDSRPLAVGYNNCRQVVHIQVASVTIQQEVQFGTGHKTVMPFGREGNRRSGVAPTMCHKRKRFIHLRAQGLRKIDQPTLFMRNSILYFLLN